jgi:hypothetical protein
LLNQIELGERTFLRDCKWMTPKEVAGWLQDMSMTTLAQALAEVDTTLRGLAASPPKTTASPSSPARARMGGGS